MRFAGARGVVVVAPATQQLFVTVHAGQPPSRHRQPEDAGLGAPARRTVAEFAPEGQCAQEIGAGFESPPCQVRWQRVQSVFVGLDGLQERPGICTGFLPARGA
ncbi:hypothetical protein GCM10010497_22150 [Streptomyces cinereoruber]|uniref:Uncharacterized protein n=1 Tax=Streptomyces cinereoruber TaxID=67260 RepID=A0AAV4KF88_9ACTN|nr:hypothetical protein GCM10010497_22150 [Streptomyces cinereoruber]